MNRKHSSCFLATLGVATTLFVTLPAQAGEVYTGIGTTGVMLGYTHGLNEHWTLRADYATLGSHHGSKTDGGIDYTGTLKIARLGTFGDWYPFSGVFRLTGGITFNQANLVLKAQGNGGTVTIGSTNITLDSSDQFDVEAKFPSTTPYLGIGWGHQARPDKGFAFSLDIGSSFGAATVTAIASQSVKNKLTTAGSSDPDADIEQQAAKVKDGVAKWRFLPQISVGLGYRF